MKKGVVLRLGIDIDARWDYSHTKGWVFRYKLHLTSTTTGDIVLCYMIRNISDFNIRFI